VTDESVITHHANNCTNHRAFLKFRKIPLKCQNSVARLEIPRPAANCGPQQYEQTVADTRHNSLDCCNTALTCSHTAHDQKMLEFTAANVARGLVTRRHRTSRSTCTISKQPN